MRKIALLILVFLSYGLRVFSLGFYWDDWPYLWFFERLGPSGIVQAFTGDRPFLSFIYIICLSIFGHSIIGWQIFGLLARWLCSLGLWWALKLTWPGQTDKAAWAAFLFFRKGSDCRGFFEGSSCRIAVCPAFPLILAAWNPSL